MESKTIHPKGVFNLVNGILAQASRDFFSSKPDSSERREVERFFRSRYFALLTGLDGKAALKQLQIQDSNRKKQKRRFVHR